MLSHNPKKRNENDRESFKKMSELFAQSSKSINTVPRPGFKQALLSRLRQARAQHNIMTKFSFTQWLAVHNRQLATVGVTAVVVIIIAVLVFQPFTPSILPVPSVYAQDNFTLTAESEDSLGIEPETSFVLESEEPMKLSDIENQLSSNLETEFELDQINSRKIRIGFAEPLTDEELVKFRLETRVTTPEGEIVPRPYAWAFQVKPAFGLYSSLPGNQTTRVPLDIGIELNFSHENIDLDSLRSAFSIEPAVAGHFEQYRRTAVFVPEKLAEGTVYTVTVDGSLGLAGTDETLGEDFVFEFETVKPSADAVSYRGSYVSLRDDSITVAPDDQPTIDFYTYQNNNPSTKVQLYRFANFDDYAAAAIKNTDYHWRAFTEVLDLVDLNSLSFEVEFVPEISTQGYNKSFVFPEPLEKGYYLALFSMNGKRDWVLINSTNLTAYLAQGTNKDMIWVNRSDTQTAVAGAAVRYLDDSNQTVTNEQGIGYLPYSQTKQMVIENGDESLLLLKKRHYYWQDHAELSPDDFWSYLYTDRETYRSNDTVNFFGFLENRDTEQIPSEVRVWIGTGEIVYDEVTVRPGPGGTFSGSLELAGVLSGYVSLKAEVDGVNIISDSLWVKEYVKPAYDLSITLDQEAVFVGDEIGYTVHGEFFEGTPVKGLQVKVSTYHWSKTDSYNRVLTLDAAGNAQGKFTVTSGMYYHNPSEPSYLNILVQPVNSEEAEISGSNRLTVFSSRFYLQAEAEINGAVGTIDLTTRNIQAIDSSDPEEFAPNLRANQTVSGTIKEITWRREELEKEYDFVRKVTVPRYEYHREKIVLETFTTTTDSEGRAIHTFAANNQDASYEIYLKVEDGQGGVYDREIYAWRSSKHEYRNYQQTGLHFVHPALADEDFPGYRVGDEVRLQVFQGEDQIEMQAPQKILYFRAHRGIQEVFVSDSSEFAIDFSEADIPNSSIYGVFFNGDGYALIRGQRYWGWYGSGERYSMDTSTQALNVELSSEGEYRPGENIKVNVKVTDANGQPVKTDVNLNIVDEAYYAIFPESVDPLSDLYSSVYDGVIDTQISREIPESAFSVEGGGGGGDETRTSFKDTAAFAMVQTNSQGLADYTFTLPDNITQWRVTAQAFARDQKMAGATTLGVDASLPFFITPVMRDSYLVGDEPTLLIRSAGTNIGLADDVEYTIEVVDQEAKVEKIAQASETVTFDLPNLPQGSYQVLISGKSGDYEDALIRQIEIVPSRLIKPVTSSVELGQGAVLEGADQGLTHVTFMNGNQGRYLGNAWSLSYRYGDRADEVLARAAATELLNEYFNEERIVPNVNVESYQPGGVRLLPYADVDPELSARLAWLRESELDENQLANYLNGYLYAEESTTRVLDAKTAALIYSGLAALDEPVLAEVQRFSQQDDLDLDTRLYVALALYFSGDLEAARGIYRELLAETTTASGYRYFEDENEETMGERTAVMAILAGGLFESEYAELYEYVSGQYHGDTLLSAEQAVYLQEVLPNLPAGPVSFSYNLRGEREQVELDKYHTHMIAVDVDELANLEARAESGKVIAVSRYDQPLASPEIGADSRLGLTRNYQVGGQVTTDFQEGDLVKVTLKYRIDQSLPSSGYQVTDILPSGLSPVTAWNSVGFITDSCVWYPYDVENQRVSFFVFSTKWFNPSSCANTISYYARVVNPGEYKAEPAVIRSARDMSPFSYSNEEHVNITQ